MMAATHDKITRRHRELQAYVYVRQSTDARKCSRIRKVGRISSRSCSERSRLRWLPEQIHLIDTDSGQSGQDSQRPGFQSLVAAVSLGQVGLILAYEASRLARNNTDWYTLTSSGDCCGSPDCRYRRCLRSA